MHPWSHADVVYSMDSIRHGSEHGEERIATGGDVGGDGDGSNTDPGEEETLRIAMLLLLADEHDEQGHSGGSENLDSEHSRSIRLEDVLAQLLGCTGQGGGNGRIDLNAILEKLKNDTNGEGKGEENEDEEDFKLCDFCAPKKRPNCFRCLIGKPGRRIQRFGNSNIHGFVG